MSVVWTVGCGRGRTHWTIAPATSAPTTRTVPHARRCRLRREARRPETILSSSELGGGSWLPSLLSLSSLCGSTGRRAWAGPLRSFRPSTSMTGTLRPHECERGAPDAGALLHLGTKVGRRLTRGLSKPPMIVPLPVPRGLLEDRHGRDEGWRSSRSGLSSGSVTSRSVPPARAGWKSEGGGPHVADGVPKPDRCEVGSHGARARAFEGGRDCHVEVTLVQPRTPAKGHSPRWFNGCRSIERYLAQPTRIEDEP